MREENEKKKKQNKTKQNKQTSKQKNFCNNNKMKWHEYLTMDQKPKKVAPM